MANFTSCLLYCDSLTASTMVSFVLSPLLHRTGPSVDMVGFTEDFESLACAEHCPPFRVLVSLVLTPIVAVY